MVDATMVHATASTTIGTDTGNPWMKQNREGNQEYFGMKAHSAPIRAVSSPARDIDVVQPTSRSSGDLLRGSTLFPDHWKEGSTIDGVL
jgi:hypothetical protein